GPLALVATGSFARQGLDSVGNAFRRNDCLLFLVDAARLLRPVQLISESPAIAVHAFLLPADLDPLLLFGTGVGVALHAPFTRNQQTIRVRPCRRWFRLRCSSAGHSGLRWLRLGDSRRGTGFSGSGRVRLSRAAPAGS